jgi:hypothetical protein
MRDLMRALGTGFAKARKLILADCQRPEQIDRTLLDSFRYRAIFNRQRQDLETDIRYSGVVNSEELIANLRLLRDEAGHKGYHAFIAPTTAGSIVRGDSVPPFRTHQTGEGDYDEVYQMEKSPRGMKTLEPVHRYIVEIISAVHRRIAERQKAEDVVEDARETRKNSDTYIQVVKEILAMEDSQSPGQVRILQKDFVDRLIKQFAVSKPTALGHVQQLARDSAVFVDRTSPRRTLLIFNSDRLRSILGSAEIAEHEAIA